MNHRSPAEYEALLGRLATQLVQRYRVEDVRWGLKNKLIGKSAVAHQIDVSFIDRTASAPRLVLIECKNLKDGNSVDLGQVKALKATLDDLVGHPTHPLDISAHLICTTKAQSGAKAYADFYGINIQRVSAGPNWVFRYQQMLQVGVALVAGSATVQGAAEVTRRCSVCQSMFQPKGSETSCLNCEGQKSAA